MNQKNRDWRERKIWRQKPIMSFFSHDKIEQLLEDPRIGLPSKKRRLSVKELEGLQFNGEEIHILIKLSREVLLEEKKRRDYLKIIERSYKRINETHICNLLPLYNRILDASPLSEEFNEYEEQLAIIFGRSVRVSIEPLFCFLEDELNNSWIERYTRNNYSRIFGDIKHTLLTSTVMKIFIILKDKQKASNYEVEGEVIFEEWCKARKRMVDFFEINMIEKWKSEKMNLPVSIQALIVNFIKCCIREDLLPIAQKIINKDGKQEKYYQSFLADFNRSKTISKESENAKARYSKIENLVEENEFKKALKIINDEIGGFSFCGTSECYECQARGIFRGDFLVKRIQTFLGMNLYPLAWMDVSSIVENEKRCCDLWSFHPGHGEFVDGIVKTHFGNKEKGIDFVKEVKKEVEEKLKPYFVISEEKKALSHYQTLVQKLIMRRIKKSRISFTNIKKEKKNETKFVYSYNILTGNLFYYSPETNSVELWNVFTKRGNTSALITIPEGVTFSGLFSKGPFGVILLKEEYNDGSERFMRIFSVHPIDEKGVEEYVVEEIKCIKYEFEFEIKNILTFDRGKSFILIGISETKVCLVDNIGNLEIKSDLRTIEGHEPSDVRCSFKNIYIATCGGILEYSLFATDFLLPQNAYIIQENKKIHPLEVTRKYIIGMIGLTPHAHCEYKMYVFLREEKQGLENQVNPPILCYSFKDWAHSVSFLRRIGRMFFFLKEQCLFAVDVENGSVFDLKRGKRGERIDGFFEIPKLSNNQGIGVVVVVKEEKGLRVHVLRIEMEQKRRRTPLCSKEMKKKGRKCEKCGIENGKLKRCSGCSSVFYCSVRCQKSDWKSHRKKCKHACKKNEKKN